LKGEEVTGKGSFVAAFTGLVGRVRKPRVCAEMDMRPMNTSLNLFDRQSPVIVGDKYK